jgi:hypothetical protein
MENFKNNLHKVNFFILLFIIYLTLKELQTFAFANQIFFSKQIYLYIFEYFFVIINIIFFFKSRNLFFINKKFLSLLKIFFFYNILIIIYGLTASDTYWDYKHIFINYLPFLFFIFVFYFPLIDMHFKFILKLYFNFIFPLSILLFFIGTNSISEFTSRTALPISLFLIFFPYLKSFHKIIMLFLSILIIFFDQTVRTHTLYIILSFFIISFYLFKINNLKFYKFLTYFIIIIPFFLIILFFIFNIDIFDYISLNYKSQNSELFANTRSFLYLEVLGSLDNFFNIIFGSGASASFESDTFRFNQFIFEEGRYSTEVGFLNIILKSGIFGFFLLSLLIFQPIFFTLNNSKNTLSKLLSLKLATYWLVLFIEQPQFIGLGYFFIFFNIGILLSSKFINLDDNEIKSYIS